MLSKLFPNVLPLGEVGTKQTKSLTIKIIIMTQDNNKIQDDTQSSQMAVSGSVILPTNYRIGNLLLEKYSKEIIEVIGLNKTQTIFSGTFLAEWQAEPIPITEEWLLKFGFKKIKNTPWYREYRIDKKNIVSFDKDDKEYSYFNLSSRLCTLKYVHQLQNLYFALTGAELTVA